MNLLDSRSSKWKDQYLPTEFTVNHFNSEDPTNIKTEWCWSEFALKIHMTTTSVPFPSGLAVTSTWGQDTPFDPLVCPSSGWWLVPPGTQPSSWCWAYMNVFPLRHSHFHNLWFYNCHGWNQLLMASLVM